MPSKVLFAPMAFSRYEATQTLPEKFVRLLMASDLGARVRGKKVAIKMHVGQGVSYSTIPPVFVRKLVTFIKENGGDCFVTDHYVHPRHPEERGYTESNLGCPVLDDCGYFGKYFYTKEVDYKGLRHIDIAGLIHDADFLIDFSHVKGHGSCGFGGACKNIAMGCVTDRTRHEIHALEGGLVWDETKCIHCEKCIPACNHYANRFKDGKYKVNTGWLLENAGLKGKIFHGFKVSDKAALILINESGKTYEDLQKAIQEIQQIVKNKYGLELEPEPVKIEPNTNL